MENAAGYDYLESTTSLCPECLRTVPAKIVAENGRVYLRKRCPQHGPQVALLEEDAAYFKRRNEFSRPGTRCATQTEIKAGCPFDCGLCPDHEQHTCIGLIEVNSTCNLACPTCYAQAGPAGELTLETIQGMVDFYIASEQGKAEILQISGGEPTLHPRILDILQYAHSTSLAYVMLNTNGLRIARDEAFARALGGFAGRFEVYLQFDGLDRQACQALRGGDFVADKLRAIELLGKYEVPITLVMTVQAGVNEGQIGEVVALAMRHPHIRGINFQPAAYFGRRPEAAPGLDRITLTGVLRRIEEQTKGLIQASDFVPLPCHVDRVAVNFLYRGGATYVPVTRGKDLRQYLPYIRNTICFRAEDFIEATSAGVTCCSAQDLLRAITPSFLLKPQRERARYINQNLFRLSVSSFIDAWNFDLKAMQKECVHVITPDHRKIPFSAYNLLHRARYAFQLA